MTMHLVSTPANITRQLRFPGWRGVPLLVILTAALPAMAIAQGTQSAGLAKINVFLGPKPKEGGFVVTNKVFQDSYRDMEEAYRKDTDNAFRPFINLVGSADQAEVIVEITSRNSPMLAENRALLATLFVVGSDFKVDLDGRTGVRHIYWNKQALNLLSQLSSGLRLIGPFSINKAGREP